MTNSANMDFDLGVSLNNFNNKRSSIDGESLPTNGLSLRVTWLS